MDLCGVCVCNVGDFGMGVECGWFVNVSSVLVRGLESDVGL